MIKQTNILFIPKIIILIVMMAVISQSSFSQEGWYQQASGTTANLKSVFFTDVNTGFAVGESGTIIKTTNGGSNWNQYIGVPNEFFNSIHFIGQTGFIVGGYNSAIIFKTTDGGNFWIDMSTFANYGLNSVFMTSSSNVHIGGNGKILRTTNGGLNWEIRNYDSTNAGISRRFRTIQFIDSLNGFIGGYTLWVGHYVGLFWVTNNGGISWSPSGLQPFLTSAYFLNSTTGYGTSTTYGACCPSYYIDKTTNAGANWVRSLPDSNRFFNSVKFHNSSTGYASGFKSGGNCSIFKTTNLGSNWYEQYTPSAGSLNSIFLIDALTGYAVGNSGTILKTTNGGTSSVISTSNEVPDKFKLYQNYPNPFNPITKIKFQIAKAGNAKLIVFDVTGREIEKLVDQDLKPGIYEVSFDGNNLSSGVYYYKLIMEGYSEVKRMVLVK